MRPVIRIRVHGRSMEPTFHADDVRWTNPWIYRVRAPRRGEVAVVDHPTRSLRILKRVVGVPGDVVEGRTLGPDEYYVRGDNLAATTDSDAFGTLPRRAFRARVRAPMPLEGALARTRA